MNSQPSHSIVKKLPLVVILGPTAVGKTEISIMIAEHLEGEIVSVDSRLFYRGMDIGTAKPSKEERSKAKHYLIDVAQPDERWSLARFQREAISAIDDIHSRNKLPLLVGGTGQYIRAVIEGWEIPKVKPNSELRKALEHWAVEIGNNKLHQNLMFLDPDAGAQIDPTNLRRTIRALEVIFSTGRLFSDQKRQSTPPYRTLLIGLNLPRPELFSRVDARIEKMLRDGFIHEVKGLLDEGYSPDLPAFSAIGYREISTYLNNDKVDLVDTIQEIKRKTRLFIRRQANWFKSNDPQINWFQMDRDTAEDVIVFIKRWLETIE